MLRGRHPAGRSPQGFVFSRDCNSVQRNVLCYVGRRNVTGDSGTPPIVQTGTEGLGVVELEVVYPRRRIAVGPSRPV